MPHKYSPEKLELRRQRARCLGFLQPSTVGRRYVSVPSEVHDRARSIIRSLHTHQAHNSANGFASHYARVATVQAVNSGKMTSAQSKRAYEMHRLAIKAKHEWRSDYVGPDPFQTADPWASWSHVEQSAVAVIEPQAPPIKQHVAVEQPAAVAIESQAAPDNQHISGLLAQVVSKLDIALARLHLLVTAHVQLLPIETEALGNGFIEVVALLPRGDFAVEAEKAKNEDKVNVAVERQVNEKSKLSEGKVAVEPEDKALNKVPEVSVAVEPQDKVKNKLSEGNVAVEPQDKDKNKVGEEYVAVEPQDKNEDKVNVALERQDNEKSKLSEGNVAVEPEEQDKAKSKLSEGNVAVEPQGKTKNKVGEVYVAVEPQDKNKEAKRHGLGSERGPGGGDWELPEPIDEVSSVRELRREFRAMLAQSSADLAGSLAMLGQPARG